MEGECVTGNWILFNRQKRPNAVFAGVLLGLGLLGHLRALELSKLYLFCADNHEMTAIGLLLGLGASYRGTMERDIFTLLSIHVPSLQTSREHPMNLPASVRSAALIATGLLYQKSGNRRITEAMLKEINRTPYDLLSQNSSQMNSASASSQNQAVRGLCREGCSLSAGFALGFTTLGLGHQTPGLSDLRLKDRLRLLIHGSSSSPIISWEGSLQVQQRQQQHQQLLHQEMQKTDPTGSIDANSRMTNGLTSLSHFKVVSSTLLDPNDINADITAPGAIVALCLMFLQTNDRDAAAILAIPSKIFQLEMIRPDFVMLRAVGFHLILWDSIKADLHWIIDQLPVVLRRSSYFFSGDRKGLEKAPAESTKRAGHVMDDGAEDLPHVQKDRSADKIDEEFEFSVEPQEFLVDSNNQIIQIQSRIQMITGIAFSIGLRFAGTANSKAQSTLLKLMSFFLAVKKYSKAQSPILGAMPNCYNPDVSATGEAEMKAASTLQCAVTRIMAESCVCNCAVALSLVMAGTGDLKSFRLLRHLQKRPKETDASISYGIYMALSLSIGLLFAGAGSYSLKRTPESIAVLFCSFFPQWPHSPADQDGFLHLQALRHLYVLALERRCLQARDVDTDRPAFVPIRLHLVPSARDDFEGQECLELTTPALLPEWRLIDRIEISPLPFSPLSDTMMRNRRFWPLELDLRRNFNHRRMISCLQTVFVKSRAESSTLSSSSSSSSSRDLSSVTSSLLSMGLLLVDSIASPSAESDQCKVKVSKEKLQHLLSQLQVDPILKAMASSDLFVAIFLQTFCLPITIDSSTEQKEQQDASEDQITSYLTFASFCTAALIDCLKQEKPEMIPTYLLLFRLPQQLHRSSQFSSILGANLRLVLSFFEMRRLLGLSQTTDAALHLPPKSLLDEGFLSALSNSIINHFQSRGMQQQIVSLATLPQGESNEQEETRATFLYSNDEEDRAAREILSGFTDEWASFLSFFCLGFPSRQLQHQIVPALNRILQNPSLRWQLVIQLSNVDTAEQNGGGLLGKELSPLLRFFMSSINRH